MILTADHKKLINLALKALANGELDVHDRSTFARDHKKYQNQELNFRELLESIRSPKGALKEAMKAHYAETVYRRTFK